MAAPPFVSPEANLRAQQRQAHTGDDAGTQTAQKPQSQSGRYYSTLKNSIATARKIASAKKRLKQFVNKKLEGITKFFDALLEQAWRAIPTTFGLSFLWVIFHGIIKYIAGVKLFPKFGRTFGRFFPKGVFSEEVEKLIATLVLLILIFVLISMITIITAFLLVIVAPFKLLAMYAIQKILTIWKSLTN